MPNACWANRTEPVMNQRAIHNVIRTQMRRNLESKDEGTRNPTGGKGILTATVAVPIYGKSYIYIMESVGRRLRHPVSVQL